MLNRRLALPVLACVVVLIAVMYLTMARRTLTFPEVVIREAAAPVQSLLERLGSRLSGLLGGVRDASEVRRENELLRTRVNKLLAEVRQFREYQRENERLRLLLSLKRPQTELVAAEVIARSPSSWNRYLIINRGSADGVKPLMAVRVPEGVVGYVGDVTPHTARVFLLLDKRVAIGGRLMRNSHLVILEGEFGNSGLVSLRPLEHGISVEVGDQVVTSGLGEIFPKGLPIGEIVEVSPGRFEKPAFALLKPYADLSRLEFVFVVKEAGEQ